MRTDKYIVTSAKLNEASIPWEKQISKDIKERVLYLDDEVVKGAFYLATSWFWKAPPGPGPQAHAHDFPEILAFFGTNPKDVHDLGGEVELWLDGEKHLLTKSFVAFIPPGMTHCPLKVTRVDRPIFHFSTGPKGMYSGNQK